MDTQTAVPRRKISRRTLITGGAVATAAAALSAGWLGPDPAEAPSFEWPALTGQRGTRPRGRILAMAFSPDSRILADIVEEDHGDAATRVVELWDVATAENIAAWTTGMGVKALAFDPTGTTLAGAGFEGTRLWDAATGDEVAELGDDTAYSVAFSPDGRMLAAGTWRGIVVWDVAARTPVTAPLDFDATDVAFSPDGTLLTALDWDEEVAGWDTSTWERSLTLPYGDPVAMRFLDSGLLCVSRDHDRALCMWDPVAGVEVGLIVPDGFIVSMALSPSGSLVAVSVPMGPDRGLQLWNGSYDRLFHTLDPPGLGGLRFSPDSRTVAGIVTDFDSAEPTYRFLLWDLV